MERSTLVKFGRLEHLEMLRDGIMYLNTLKYFWEIEDGDLRGDRFDTIDKIIRHNTGVIELTPKGGKTLRGEVVNFEYREHTSEPESINLFCMYALRPAHGSFPVDPRNLAFGDYALVLLEPQRFIDLTHQAIVDNGIQGSAGIVEYVDNDFAGEMGPFRKLRRFEYQSEWRMVTYGGMGTARNLELGSLSDIVKIVRSEDLNTIVAVSS